ncbi:MAG TPA: carbon-nitrogen family hydrolase [Chthonomonadaceae bacterium]|nr:carbon-nitrogen family hydrolase [Chthonomonadaceae bacterium]
MNVVGCQLDIVWENKAATHARVRALLEAQPPAKGSLLVLPEMFATGFSMAPEKIAEGEARESERFLAQIAEEFGVAVVGGVVNLGPDGRGRNEAVVFGSNGREIARYQKMHPFTFGGESKHYSSGDKPLLFPYQEFTVAPFVCYDLRFPEVFRSAVRQGAQVFVVIANWPQPREQHWMTLLQARAIENQAYVVGVNRCGSDPKLAYSGRSQIVDPKGVVLADAGNAEGLISAELDLSALRDYRRTFPALEDMHPEYVPIRSEK